MIRFGIRVGTRRLEFLAMDVLAEAFRRQAVLLGQLQYLLTRVGQDSAAADVLRQLPDAHQSALVVLEDATRQVEAHAFGPSERLHGA